MSHLRRLVAAALFALAGTPLLFPLLEAARRGAGTEVGKAGRLLDLAGNTAALAGLALLIALPLGTLWAVLLYRSDLPGRRALRGLLLVSLFVPLPLFAAAWQAALGTGGLFAGWLAFASPGKWVPWDQGLVPAALVHGLASLPWVVWIVGHGLAVVEPELEEDALLVVPPLRVLSRVTLRRAAPAFAVAALWVIVQATGEVAVTDPMLVRSFAEEVYTQFVLSGGLAGAVILSLPQVLLLAALAGATAWRWQRRSPPLLSWPADRPLLRLRRARPVWCLAAFACAGVLAGVPLASLGWKAGGGADPAGWSPVALARALRLVVQANVGLIGYSLVCALAAGVVAAGLALAACWLARGAGWLRAGLLLLAVALWVTPGPVLGYGVKEAINRLLDLEDAVLGSHVTARPLTEALYRRPTPLPVLWVDVLRVLPFALALLWPAARAVPADLLEAARVDGASPMQELRFVIWPLTASAFGRAVLVGTVLSLGELSAGKMVEVPGRRTFSQELFNQMHYGVTSTVAALCLLQLGAVAVLAGVLLRHGRLAFSSPAHQSDRLSPPGPGTLRSEVGS